MTDTSDVDTFRRHPATEYMQKCLLELGMSCDAEGTVDTPARFVKAFYELTYGCRVDPDRHLKVTFPPQSFADTSSMISVVDVPFTSLCEHHLSVFTGTATLAYIPAPEARIVGLSKLARVIQEYAAQPQIQERLGDQIIRAVSTHLDTLGVGCVLRASHTCMTLRGVQAHGASMRTTHLSGSLRDDMTLRTEFLHSVM